MYSYADSAYKCQSLQKSSSRLSTRNEGAILDRGRTQCFDHCQFRLAWHLDQWQLTSFRKYEGQILQIAYFKLVQSRESLN